MFIESQEVISIPIAFIETFVMTFVSFLIGYISATLYAKSQTKKLIANQKEVVDQLNLDLSNLKDEIEAQIENSQRKDRMDQDFEQVQFQKRAYSPEVISSQAIKTEEKPTGINFERIGVASASERNELQRIVGIGPYTEAKLNELGIHTFEQISKFTSEDIKVVTKLIKFFPDRIKNDRWVEKATKLKNDLDAEEDVDITKKLKKEKSHLN